MTQKKEKALSVQEKESFELYPDPTGLIRIGVDSSSISKLIIITAEKIELDVISEKAELYFNLVLVDRKGHFYFDCNSIWIRDKLSEIYGIEIIKGKKNTVHLQKIATDDREIQKIRETIELGKKHAETFRRLRLNPNLEIFHVELGNILYNKGQLDEAIKEYQEALRIKPNYAKAHNNLGIIFHDKGQLDKAIREYQEALSIKPNYADAHNNLGNTLKTSGQLDEAIQHYQEALKIKPNNAAAHSNLGAALKAKDQLDEAIQHYQEALRINPNFLSAHYNLGIALKAKGREDEAIKEFQEALRISPNDADIHNKLGDTLFAKGRADEAIKEYQEALRIDPKHNFANVNLKIALKDKEHWSKIDYQPQIFCSLCGKAAKIGQRFCTSCGARLSDRQMTELPPSQLTPSELDEAIKEYKKAIKINADDIAAHVNLGDIFYAQGRIRKAIKEFQEALRIDPYYAEVHYRMGVIFHLRGQIDEAIKELHEALAIDPDLAIVHNNLGLCLHDKGRFNEAIEEFQEAIKLDPNAAFAYYNLGLSLMQLGQIDQAIVQFKEAIRINPTEAKPHIALRDAFYAKGNLSEAVKEFTEVIRINPDLVDDRILKQVFKDRYKKIEKSKEALRTMLRGEKRLKISGGDGLSMSNAIIISECNNPEGITQEYIELQKRFGHYKKINRRLIKDKNKYYDVYDLEVKGKRIKVYFDVTNFIGKW